jgi:hypothetical protein
MTINHSHLNSKIKKFSYNKNCGFEQTDKGVSAGAFICENTLLKNSKIISIWRCYLDTREKYEAKNLQFINNIF